MILATLSLLSAGIVEAVQPWISVWHFVPQQILMGASLVFVIPAGIAIFVTASKMGCFNENLFMNY